MVAPLFSAGWFPFHDLDETPSHRNTGGHESISLSRRRPPRFQFIGTLGPDTRNHHSNMDVYARTGA